MYISPGEKVKPKNKGSAQDYLPKAESQVCYSRICHVIILCNNKNTLLETDRKKKKRKKLTIYNMISLFKAFLDISFLEFPYKF